jgi:hypothetical protein
VEVNNGVLVVTGVLLATDHTGFIAQDHSFGVHIITADNTIHSFFLFQRKTII